MSAQLQEAPGAVALENALALAEHGCWMFPVDDAKHPLVKGWQAKATRDADNIRAFADQFPGCNFGISTGKFGNDGALCVIDVDRKGSKDGFPVLAALEAEHGALPASLRCETPSGGLHIIMSVAKAVQQGVDVLGTGIDIRSQGGYIVAPGSYLPPSDKGPGGEYRVPVASSGIERAPAWLIERCGKPRERSTVVVDVSRINQDAARARAVDYLRVAERSVKGAGGDQAAYRVAAKLKDFGLPAADALDLMLSEHWDHGCGWAADRLETKVKNAYRYGNDAPGADAPETKFEPIIKAKDEAAKVHPLEELNRHWCVVAESPNVAVYRKRRDSRTGQMVFERYTREAFFGLLADQRFKNQPLAQAWWESPRRERFTGGIDFAPGINLSADVLNTWGGFAVQAKAGDWNLMRSHIRDIICAGDDACDQYVMGWLARMVQKPAVPGEVALVCRGARGTGKGTLGEELHKMFGVHGLHVSNPRRVTGDFNGHLVGKVFLFADEAFFAGDKKHESVLKTLITEKALDVEAKFQAARNVRNCLHLLMASNDDWVVRAGPLERRFCVLDVAKTKQQNIAYFGAIRHQMDNGGREAMLHDLLTLDISAFDPWKVPKTRAGAEQQARSLSGPEGWLYDALKREQLTETTPWEDGPVSVGKAYAYSAYSRSLAPKEWRVAEHLFWTKLREIFKAGNVPFVDARPRVGGTPERHMVFPGLKDAQAALSAYTGAQFDWEDPDPSANIFS